jgi:hypothetical protein
LDAGVGLIPLLREQDEMLPESVDATQNATATSVSARTSAPSPWSGPSFQRA